MSFAGKDLINMPESERRKLRGGQMSMIFQDPMTSLNPSFTVGFQLSEILREHQDLTKAQAWERSRELLGMVGIPDAESRMQSYSYQLSGGMSQRVMIAIAVACRPKLLIADEPTTALDVTIQAQILELIKKLQKEHKMALILITHDIGVVAQMADQIAVMYAGQVVEEGPLRDIIDDPKHPYTKGLLDCLPGMHGDSEHRSKLPSIAGLVPDLVNRPSGCQFHPRCSKAKGQCTAVMPQLKEESNRLLRCYYPVGS
jgi:dipeptide transport system ATP-binding protein